MIRMEVLQWRSRELKNNITLEIDDVPDIEVCQMEKPIVRDAFFLNQKSEEATKVDLPIAQDLEDRAAHRKKTEEKKGGSQK